MKKLITISIIALALFACGTTHLPVTQVPVQTRVEIREKLVPVQLPPDSSQLIALFECDSLNQVVMKQNEELKGKSTASELAFKDGQLLYKVIYKDRLVYVPTIDTNYYKEVPIEVPGPAVVTNELKWWQEVLMWAGVVMLLQIVLIIFSLIKTP